MVRKFVCVLMPFLMVCVPAARSAGQDAEFTDEAVTRAIEKGIKYLWSKQRTDGSWAGFKKLNEEKYYPYGPGAIAMYALLEAGESPQEERMAKALDWLSKGKTQMTYTLALRCNVYLAANRKTGGKYMKHLQKDVDLLVKSTGDGAYGYFCRGDGITSGGDSNSNSQFGLLGVWAGRRGNAEIKKEYWWKVMRYWMNIQWGNGGWIYGGNERQVRPTMCAAGLASLFVCYDNIFAEGFAGCNLGADGLNVQLPIKRGLDWFDRNFERTARGGNLYYMYGVERVGLASGYKYFGKADWYKIGTKVILRRQQSDGGWGNVHNSAFALLFLARGRHAVLFNKLRFPGDWNNRPRDLANLTRWISRTFETTVSWQIINLKVPVREWHDAPILYISGAQAPMFTEADIAKLRDFVWQGGTIFSCTECNGAKFRQGIRDLYSKLFPKYEMKTLPPKHELYSLHFTLRGRPRFHMISNGVRPLVIHTDNDLPRAWQLNKLATQRRSFEAAANVYLYVTGKGSLRHRGVSLWPEEPDFTPTKTVKLLRLKYAGNYDPEPLAYERFARLMGKKAKIKVEVGKPMDITALPDAGAKLAVLTGTSGFTLAAEEKQAMKKFVAGGGTILIDAAGGSKQFAESAEKLLASMYGPDSLRRLSPLSPLFGLKGMEIEKVKYRKQTAKVIRSQAPNLRAVLLGKRPAVIFSKEDLTAGLVGYPSHIVHGYDPQSAYEIMRNIVLYADQQAAAKPEQPG